MTSARRPHWAGELAVVALLLVGYDRAADLAGVHVADAVDRGQRLLGLERRLHLAPEHGLDVWLGRHPLPGSVAAVYYDLAHVLVTVAVLAALWLLRPETYRRARTALVLVNLVALVAFVLEPVAPPRLLPAAGFADVVAASGTWGAWEQGSLAGHHPDEYASMPSLHAAWAVWVLLVVVAASGRRWRSLAAVHLLLTVLVVLATGNHYLLDVLAGAGLSGAAWALADVAAPARLPAERRGGVLVVTASMGAGHDGVAYELARRWEEQGTPVTVVDFLHVLPLGIGPLLRRIYGLQLAKAPATYEWLYDVIDRRPSLNRVAGLVAGTARRRLRRLVREGDPRLVVATYPLAGRALGQLRRGGRLRVPTVTFLTDLDVHTTWLDAGTDLYLAVYDGSAREATRRTGRPARAGGPVLPPGLAAPVGASERLAARSAMDLAADDRVALMVTGSWGVGAVQSAAESLRASGALPVVLCGRNELLRARLADAGLRALGWTSAMRPLYAAADVVIHNAGGLSSLEAMAAGVPVVGHACLPGHGLRNARAMADAGVAELAESEADLVDLVHRLARTPAGADMAARARALFRNDATALVGDLSRSAPAAVVRRPLGRRLAAALVLLPAALVVSTVGVSSASERGFGVARAPHSATPEVFVGVLLDPAETADPRTAGLLQRAGVSAVVPAPIASADPGGVRSLAVTGVSVLGAFPRLPRRPGAARTVCEQAREQVADASRSAVPSLVSVHGLGVWSLSSAHRAGTAVGVARPVLDASSVHLHDGGQVVLTVPAGRLDSTLVAVLAAAAADHLAVHPLGALWD